MPNLKQWFASRSVFSILLISSVILTAVLATVLIITLREIADEHPRRQLAKVLFQKLVSNKNTEEISSIHISKTALLVIPVSSLSENRYTEYTKLFELAKKDPDGIAILRNRFHLMAAFYRGPDYVLIPVFGDSFSDKALALTLVLILSILITLMLSYWVIRKMTQPFSTLIAGARQIESGDLSYRMPLDKTYGEFLELAKNFNSMVERLQRIHEVRRHMLLAIPHELRTPLTRLKVRKDLIKDDNLRGAVLNDINNLEGILNAILLTEKNAFSQLKEVNIAELLKRILPEYQSEEQSVTPHIHTGQPFCKGTEESINILLHNLLSNAVFYGEQNPIDIHIEASATDKVCIRIMDQGIGIDSKQIPFLTEPFWRTDPSRQRQSGGYGLGLYICKTIITELGGTLEIISALGTGTEVRVSLPQ